MDSLSWALAGHVGVVPSATAGTGSTTTTSTSLNQCLSGCAASDTCTAAMIGATCAGTTTAGIDSCPKACIQWQGLPPQSISLPLPTTATARSQYVDYPPNGGALMVRLNKETRAGAHKFRIFAGVPEAMLNKIPVCPYMVPRMGCATGGKFKCTSPPCNSSTELDQGNAYASAMTACTKGTGCAMGFVVDGSNQMFALIPEDAAQAGIINIVDGPATSPAVPPAARNTYFTYIRRTAPVSVSLNGVRVATTSTGLSPGEWATLGAVFIAIVLLCVTVGVAVHRRRARRAAELDG